MTSIMDAKSNHRAPAMRLAGLVIASAVLFGTSVVSAGAEDRHGDRRGGERHDDRGHGGGGGYYAAPPVVYGNPGYAAPPVVYGPAVGIALPGVSIGIQ
jgi:hypothetical protein